MYISRFLIVNIILIGLLFSQDNEGDIATSSDPVSIASDSISVDTTVKEIAEEVVAKEASGWNVGGAASVGLLKGKTFTEVPTGGTVVITTPFGFQLGPFDYTVSIEIGRASCRERV